MHLGSGDFPCRVYFIGGEKELPAGGEVIDSGGGRSRTIRIGSAVRSADIDDQ